MWNCSVKGKGFNVLLDFDFEYDNKDLKEEVREFKWNVIVKVVIRLCKI